MTMATFSAEYPLVNMMDQDTIEQLMRKLPPDIVEKHVQEDSDFLQKIEEYGVRFKIDRNLAAKVLEHVYMSSINMNFETPETRTEILMLLLNGAIDQIVED